MHPQLIAKMVGTGNNKIKMPVPNIPMPRVELKERARAVQVNMASVVAIVVRQMPVLLLSWETSLPSESRQQYGPHLCP